MVYYLKAVSWTVADFSVERNLDHLLALQKQLEQQGTLVFGQRMMMVKVKKESTNVEKEKIFDSGKDDWLGS